MTKFDEKNRGSIWKNDRKEKDTHPDFAGSINVDGKDYWLNGWKRKEGANPKSPAMSFTVRPKDAADTKPPAKKEASRSIDMDDEVPF